MAKRAEAAEGIGAASALTTGGMSGGMPVAAARIAYRRSESEWRHFGVGTGGLRSDHRQMVSAGADGYLDVDCREWGTGNLFVASRHCIGRLSLSGHTQVAGALWIGG